MKGLSTYKLAALVGVSQSCLSQLENGRKDKPPSPEIIRKMFNALEVDYFELMRLAGYMDPVAAPSEKDIPIDHSDPAFYEKAAKNMRENAIEFLVNDRKLKYNSDPIAVLLSNNSLQKKLYKAIRSI